MDVNWRLVGRQGVLRKRAAIIEAIRAFFVERGFMEVETPHRIPAPAPESHIDAIPADGWFLHTSPELCMKRLLAAGYDRLFQLCRCWRGGERGSLHLPEFTILEWYRTGGDYHALMEDCEALVTHVGHAVGLKDRIVYQGRSVDLARPWPRLSVSEAFAQRSHMTPEQALHSGEFDAIMAAQIEPFLGLGQPTFLYDYPAERGSLARLRVDDPGVAERFELYIANLELANGFSELVDAEEQRARFEREESFRRSQGKRPYPTAERFLQGLPSMPPSAGIALGVDRLVMLLVDASTIDEVVAFTPEEL
jgi:lysyl-tRNA synthetase class 2